MNEKISSVGQGAPFMGRDEKQYYSAKVLDSGYR